MSPDDRAHVETPSDVEKKRAIVKPRLQYFLQIINDMELLVRWKELVWDRVEWRRVVASNLS